MLVIPGQRAKDLCDQENGLTRRELMRVGGSSMLGLSLAQLLRSEDAQAAANIGGGPGWGKAKSVILVYLQGGPSHLDLWDPKENVPENVQSAFKTIETKVPGVNVTELMPKFSQITDKVTMVRSMSYTPVGLFNHTAAIYQMHTGYTADKISPSGQLEPPSPKDFPTFGSNISRLKPPEVPMLPFVVMPRALQESNVVNKGGTAGFLGKAYDPYRLYSGNLDNVRVQDLSLPADVTSTRLSHRANLRELINEGMPKIDRAVKDYSLDSYYETALNLITSGRARKAFSLSEESDATKERYGKHLFGQCCLMARRLVEAGTRVVEVVWPAVANSGGISWDMHTDLTKRIKNESAPVLDAGLSGLISDLDERGMLDETLVVAVGEFGRSPQRGVSTSGNGNSADGRDHWPYCYTACVAGAGTRRGAVYGKSDKTASAPLENAVHPIEMLATIYHALGINPQTVVYNHLNQPRELVKAEAVTNLFV
jgi:hypothetical protein